MKKYIFITVLCLCFCVGVVSYVIGNSYRSHDVGTMKNQEIASNNITKQSPELTPTQTPSPEPASTPRPTPVPTIKPEPSQNPYTVTGNTVDFEEGYSITFRKAEHTKMDSLGKTYDVVILTLDYTNNSSETDSYAFTLRDSAFQNGVELEEFYNHDLMPSDSNTTKDVRPGSTVEITLAYKLTDRSNMEFEIGYMYSDEEDRFLKTYTLE
ncbi:DUF5067 domain-containing protein [Cellulosilyticum sp. WCF-2]|uniref:DUF5067 domain-containing protein n=1 Tax=Cellulosilyticum sp. WCF-2 TaxID=2497860 RepID=UPI000F8D1A96|nr:DUF5067 domain-containing protein [Cellulosilyticum sp. WCF-2]QEH69707.1 DUF5067 domain-containing protein [Cellulosilyticum sp. WCF-2]